MKPKPNTQSGRGTRNRNNGQLTPDLSKRELTLLARITSADSEQGCRASNHQFIKLLKIGERQVRRDLAALREKNFITVQIESGNERVLRLTAKGIRFLRRR